ncbi:helix-hairpin-helix domain-containing protein [Elusimicrobiota bacterium]
MPHLLSAKKPVNLNSASYDELVSLLHIDKGMAELIIDYRNTNDGFKTADELDAIIDADLVEYLQSMYNFYAVSQEVWDSGIVSAPGDLKPEVLAIKTFSLDGYAIYMTFPDGGNMLVDTGNINDADKLISLLKREMLVGKESKIMTAFGWKPRIDWLVISHLDNKRIGGMKKVLESFDVKEIITSIGIEEMESNVTFKRILTSGLVSDSIQTNLVDNDEIDLKQTESPVKMVAIGPEYYGRDTSLCLKITYKDFSCIILSDLSIGVQNSITNDYDAVLKSDFLYSGRIENKLMRKIDPDFIVTPNKSNTIITDGYLTFKKTGMVNIPAVNEETTQREEAQKYFREAMYYFKKNKKREARMKLAMVEELDASYLLNKEDELFSIAKQYLRDNEFDKTKEELDKVVFINPDNEEAKEILKRAKEALK